MTKEYLLFWGWVVVVVVEEDEEGTITVCN